MTDRNFERNRRDLTLTLVITASYCLVEFGGGMLTNSLALLSDAGHMLADVAALGLSLFAIRLAQFPPTASKTFGYHRVEILAALANALLLWVIVGLILYEAYHRFLDPPLVKSAGMIAIASIGLAVNLVSLVVLRRSQAESLNVRAAFVHVLGDALGSVGAVLAGIAILVADWYVADPIASVGIGLLILYSSWEIIRDSVDILMQGTPRGLRVEDVEQCLLGIEGVRQVHDLHIWSLTSGRYHLSAHLVICGENEPHSIIDAAQTRLCERFGIDHTTVQVDREVECAQEFRVH
ncbi:MAG TPA: cation diffusion facilitator family transporter [Candidatus Binatia bacterium]